MYAIRYLATDPGPVPRAIVFVFRTRRVQRDRRAGYAPSVVLRLELTKKFDEKKTLSQPAVFSALS